MNILVLNAGSSSLKYALIQLPHATHLLSGLIENIASQTSQHNYKIGNTAYQNNTVITDYAAAFAAMFAVLTQAGITIEQLNAIAHRVVHGGALFQQPTAMNAATITALKQLNPLAPLHNPANILGIETALHYAPHLPQIAVFDTAFHANLPDYAYRYAIPK